MTKVVSLQIHSLAKSFLAITISKKSIPVEQEVLFYYKDKMNM